MSGWQGGRAKGNVNVKFYLFSSSHAPEQKVSFPAWIHPGDTLLDKHRENAGHKSNRLFQSIPHRRWTRVHVTMRLRGGWSTASRGNLCVPCAPCGRRLPSLCRLVKLGLLAQDRASPHLNVISTSARPSLTLWLMHRTFFHKHRHTEAIGLSGAPTCAIRSKWVHPLVLPAHIA